MEMNVLKKFNADTMLVYHDDHLRVIKRISPAEVPIYSRIMSIACPNIAHITDIVDMDGATWAVQEYIEGPTLEEYLTTTRPDTDTVLAIMGDLCDALAPLHAAGIIHRDISPKNIVLSAQGARLIDFGISRIVKSDKTRDTEILGTRGYAAPEQFGFAQTGPRADIYALGVLLNVMLTGALPNQKTAPGMYERIVSKCVHMDESRRYDNVLALKADLSRKSFWYYWSALPGFRTNTLYKKIISLSYFGFTLAMIIMSPISFDNRTDTISWILFCIFGMLVPPFIFMDYLHWSERLPLMRDVPSGSRRALRIFIGIVCVIVGMLCIGLTPPTS